MIDEIVKPKDKIVTVRTIDQIPAINYDEEKMVKWIVEQRQFMISDRQQWSNRHRKYLSNWDDYITYARAGPWDECSNLHLPITMQMVKALHARFKAALFAVRPWWQIIPLEKMDVQRIADIDVVMRWACQNYVNHYKGIESAVDDWIWDFVTVGWGVMKRRWDICQRKAIIIEKVQANQQEISEQFNALEQLSKEAGYMQEETPPKVQEAVAKEVEKMLTYFDGPILEPLPHEDILFPGSFVDVSDLNQPNMVCHDYKIDESTLNQYANQGFFDDKAVEDVIKKGLEAPGSLSENADAEALKRTQDQYQGVKTVDAQAGVKFARLSECYMKYDIDDDGIDEELIVTYNTKSRTICRTTYLDRVTKTGKRPLHKVDFIRRPRRAYSIGMLELLYPIQEELDAVHNMRMDFGTISNLPFFFYRPTSGMKPEKIKLEPGTGYPLDDPNADINFPRMGNSTSWGFQEEASLISWAERLTSITAMNMGMPSEKVGASRTASGMMALLNEGNQNIDLMLGRLKEGYGDVLRGLLADLQERLPEEQMIRVTGPSGEQMFKDKAPWFKNANQFDIAGRADFFLLANSANSNRELEKQNAIMMQQMLMNPINLQLGIVQPNNVYNIFKRVLQKHGEQAFDDLITEPKNVQLPMSLYDELAAITQGLVPRVVLQDNHQAKIAGLQAFAKEPSFQEGVQNGVNSSNALAALSIAIDTHTQMAQAISAQAGPANVTGLQLSPTLGARMSGAVGETGRPLPQENIPKGQTPLSAADNVPGGGKPPPGQ